MFLSTLWGGIFLPMHFGSHTSWAIFHSIPAVIFFTRESSYAFSAS